MVPIAELRAAADAVFGKIEGLDPKKFFRHRRRHVGSGACYYGRHYFNSVDTGRDSVELQLTRSMPLADGCWKNQHFSVWIGGYGDLRSLTKKLHTPIVGDSDWIHFSFAPLDHEGHVVTFPSNRPSFGKAVVEATGIGTVWSCRDLENGLEPPTGR